MSRPREQYAVVLPWSRCKRNETLEQLIRRVCTDAAAVGADMTPELLAAAIRDAGWQRNPGWFAGPNKRVKDTPH